MFPNLTIALEILLSLPVSVASAETSFSKLKFIKNYLRSTMHQDRLSNLALLSIESDLSENLNVEQIVDQFANAKVRRVPL